MVRAEKEDPNLITVFICFLRSGLRFTRTDTNNVGLAFIEELKRLNPGFKPIKVTQTERDQEYTVNAYPKEFEQLIMSLIEEYRKKHDLPYRLKKTAPKRGGFKKPFGEKRPYSGPRTGGYQGGNRPEGNRGYGSSSDGNRGGYGQGGSRPDGDRSGNSWQGGERQGGYRSGGYHGGNRSGGYQGGNRDENNRSGNSWQGGNRQGTPRTDGERQGGWQGGNRQGGYQSGGGGYTRRDYNDRGGYPPRPNRNDQSGGYGNRGDNQGYLDGGYRPRSYGDQKPEPGSGRVRENYFNKPDTPSGLSYRGTGGEDENKEKPKRPRRESPDL